MENGIHKLGYRLKRKSLFLTCQVKNGFRDRITQLKSFGVVPSLALFALSCIALFMMLGGAGLAAGMKIAPAFAIKFKRDGLEGDDKKAERELIDSLEKRIEKLDLPDLLSKEDREKEYKKAIEAELVSNEKFKSIDFAKLAEQLDEKTGLKTALLKLGEEVAKLKAEKGGGEKPESIRKQVEMWVTTNKVALDGLKSSSDNRQQIHLPSMQIKAAITMLESASLNGSAYLPNVQVLPGVIEPIRIQPTFWQRLAKGVSRANPLVWVNKHNPQGAAVFTSEGNAKPAISFELETQNSSPVKIPAKLKVSTEMLTDIDYLTSLITGELAYQVDKATNTGVLTGTGIAPNPKGVTLYGSLYSLGSLTGVIAPNNSDAIRAAIAQLRSLNVDGALTAYINPIDAAQMDLAKSLQGQYVLPPFTTADGRNIAATPVVEDNNIAVGYLLLGDMSKYHVMIYQDFTISWGWENDDFTKNLVTVIGERRFHQWVSDNETIAFVYDTFANIKTAIS